MKAIGEAHADHVIGTTTEPASCPGAGGRIKVNGKWVDMPLMESGRPAKGVLVIEPLPRWWVTR